MYTAEAAVVCRRADTAGVWTPKYSLNEASDVVSSSLFLFVSLFVVLTVDPTARLSDSLFMKLQP